MGFSGKERRASRGGRARPRMAGLLSPLYIRGRGHPKGTPNLLLAVSGAPSTVTHLGHIVVVLRRSPVMVNLSSPPPRRRADGTLPWARLDQELEGRHRAERVLNAEVPYDQCQERLDRKDVRLHQPRY